MSLYAPIHASIESVKDELCDLSLKLHADPEIGYEEVKACAWQVEMLKGWGLEVETPYGGINTAYLAKFGSGKPVFAVFSEYDALPKIGHACGHNLIAACALGTGKAIGDFLKLENIPGTVLIVGSPSEETGGSKVLFVEQGCFDGVDAVIMAHPSYETRGWRGALGVAHYEIAYRGQASHAAACPEKGKNALDAVMLLFAGVNAWREHLPDDTRIHGIVTDGGAAPNIVPANAACSFYVRANDVDMLSTMERRFESIAEAAAIMTDTEVTISIGGRYMPGLPNQTLNRAYREITEEIGMSPIPISASRGGSGSTDFSDVSQIVPGAHVYFAICEMEIASHSEEFALASATDFAQQQMLKTAEALANIAYRFFTEPEFRNEVIAEDPQSKRQKKHP